MPKQRRPRKESSRDLPPQRAVSRTPSSADQQRPAPDLWNNAAARFVSHHLRSLQFAHGNAFIQQRLVNRNLTGEPGIQRETKPGVKGQPVRNPSFEDARNYVGRYFDRQRDIHGLLVSARDMAFEKFKVYSGEEYNKKSDSSLLQLFELALSLLPLAGPALKAFKSLRYGNSDLVALIANFDSIQRIDRAASAVGTAVKVKEGVEKGSEPIKKVKGIEEAGEVPASRATLEFQLQTISSLMDLSKKEVMNIWNAEDVIYGHLDSLKYTTGNDLEQIVKSKLGELPDASALESLVDGVARYFELALYKAYYCDEKRARRLYTKESKDAPASFWGLQGMPDGVQQRITNLYGWHLVPVPREEVILPSDTRLKGGMKF